MKRVRLQKRYNGYIVAFLLAILASVFLAIGIGWSFSEGKNSLGITFTALTVVALGGTLSLMLVKRKKYFPLIVEEMEKELVGTMDEREGKRIFYTSDLRTVKFSDDGLVFDGNRYKKEGFTVAYVLCAKSHMLHDDLSLALAVAVGEERAYLPLNGDVLDALRENGIVALNEADLTYFLNEPKKLIGKCLRTAMTSKTQSVYYPLVFAKNEQERKKAKKKSAWSWGKLLLSVLVWLTVVLTIAWLTGSERGVKLLESRSETIGLVLLIAYTAVFFLCAFVKAKRVALYQKLLLCAYPLAFWLSVFFLNERTSAFVDLAFFSVFLLLCTFDFQTKKIRSKNPSLRFLIPVFVLFLFGRFGLGEMEFLDGGAAVALAGGIVAGVAVLLSTVWAVRFIRRKKQTDTYQKKKDFSLAFSVPFCLLVFGFVLGFYYSSAFNYIFDTSAPTACSEEVIEVVTGRYSDYARVSFRGEELNVPLSGSERFDYEVGDTIEFVLYEGAFGWEYVRR